MAKIATVRDLIKTEIQGTEPKIDKRLGISLQRGTAADFLAQSNKATFKQTPVSLRSRIQESNSFVNPEKQFSRPTLLKNIGKNPEATIEVAEAHTEMSKAEIKALEIKDHTKSWGNIKAQEVIRATRVQGFSRIPRTIENLIK